MVTSKRKRSRSLTILLFPVIAPLFIIGFCMYFIGEKERITIKKQPDQSESNDFSILPLDFEEHKEKIYV